MISRQCFLFAKRALRDMNNFLFKNLVVVLPFVFNLQQREELEATGISSSQTAWVRNVK